MPQTVALQRGTTSVSANNTDSVTLFTQSGGIATRVIVNALSVRFSPTLQTSRDLCIMLILNQSGGQSYMIGYMFQTSNGNTSWQFVPGVNTANSFTGAFITSTTSPVNRFNSPQPILTGGGSNGIGSGSASNVSVRYPATTGAATDALNLLNSNFYMGPSDTISMKCQGWYQSGKGTFLYATANISFSFTTITES